MRALVLIHGFFLFCCGAAVTGWAQDEIPEGLTWEQCLKIAAEHNADLQTSLTRFEEADGQIILLRSFLYPRLNLRAQASPTTAEYNVTQVLYSRALLLAQRIGRLGRQAAEANLEFILTDVVYHLRIAFLRAVYALEFEKIQADYAARLANRTKNAPLLFEAGKLTKAAVTRLQVRTEQAQNAVQQAHTEAIRRRLDLDALMGKAFSPPPRLVGELSAEMPPEMNLQVLTEEAQKKRRDLVILEKLRLISVEQIAVVAASAYPIATAAVDGQFQASGTDIRSLYEKSNDDEVSNLTGRLAISWRIFDARETYGQKLKATYTAKQQQELVEDVRRNIPGEVDGAVNAVRKSAQALDELSRGPTADDLLELTQADFDAGKANALDILDTEARIYLQRNAKLQALLSVELAKAQLDLATGRVIQLVPQPAPMKNLEPLTRK